MRTGEPERTILHQTAIERDSAWDRRRIDARRLARRLQDRLGRKTSFSYRRLTAGRRAILAPAPAAPP